MTTKTPMRQSRDTSHTRHKAQNDDKIIQMRQSRDTSNTRHKAQNDDNKNPDEAI
jgi:hypothetical protein